jgi:putative transposase
MRYPASEKLEIIRVVEESALPVRRTLEKIGIPRATFYRWYDLYQAGGPEALDDRHPKLDRVWNRIPDDVRERIIGLALDEPALSARELAVRFTDTEGLFCLRGLGLSATKGSRSDRQSGLHRDEGCG